MFGYTRNKLFKLFAGFSLIGVFMTILTMALIYLFLKVLQTPLIITYVVIYTFAIILSYYLNASMVFKSKKSKSQLFLYFAIYVSSMMIGIFLLWVFKETLSFENWILGYMVIPFTMLWNFIFASRLFKISEQENS
jgi:putative flippase GtrA